MISTDFKCFICGSESYYFLYGHGANELYDHGKGYLVTDNVYGKSYPIIKCKICGLVTTLRPNDDYILSKYVEVQDPDYMLEEKNRRIPFRRVLNNLCRLGGGQGILLDIGTFCGLLLDEAQKMGFDTIGIEPSEWATHVGRQKYSVNIINDIYPTRDKIGNPFKFITIIDVLEHVSNPVNILSNAREQLVDDGIIVIVTPDFGSVARRILQKKWWHIRIAHLHYFDENVLIKLLHNVGLRVIKKNRYRWCFSLSYWLSRLLNRERFQGLNNMLDNKNIKKHLLNISINLNLFDSFEWYCQKERR